MNILTKFISLPAPLVMKFTKIFLSALSDGLDIQKSDIKERPIAYGLLGWLLLYDLASMICAAMLPFVAGSFLYLSTVFVVSALYGAVMWLLLIISAIELFVKTTKLYFRKINIKKLLKSSKT